MGESLQGSLGKIPGSGARPSGKKFQLTRTLGEICKPLRDSMSSLEMRTLEMRIGDEKSTHLTEWFVVLNLLMQCERIVPDL
jgi:hypothetical protein